MSRNYDAKNRIELELFINQVAEKILQNNLSLFVGAGSSMQYNFMSWRELMEEIYDGCNDWNNTEKAQYAELKGIEVKKKACEKMTSKTIELDMNQTYLNYLLDFNLKSIWTTNYDLIIEKVLEKKEKKYIPIFKYNDFQSLSYPNENFLFKINGSCSSPESIVITKNDFIDYRTSHEAYLILLKRELLCHNFLFIGCSFDDDILRICIKDILNCIDNSRENYIINHYAIIAERNKEKLNYISTDLLKHYNVNCLLVDQPCNAHRIAYGISNKVKYSSIFISGAKSFERHSAEEDVGKKVCKGLVKAFMNIKAFPFKFISGMGMSIGNFICGSIKESCDQNKNLNRYLQMEPFPFTSPKANKKHRKDMVSKAGIFVFLYGDYEENNRTGGMWQEYYEAKNSVNNIIVPIPCGENSISKSIFELELEDKNSFSYRNQTLLIGFEHENPNEPFFTSLVDKIILASRMHMDEVLDEISKAFID